jgi:hypothetical protein
MKTPILMYASIEKIFPITQNQTHHFLFYELCPKGMAMPKPRAYHAKRGAIEDRV